MRRSEPSVWQCGPRSEDVRSPASLRSGFVRLCYRSVPFVRSGLLWLGLHDGWRAWKGFDWDAMDWLHGKGMISDPVGKAKSVVFTEDGRREAERLFRELFARRP